LKTFDLAPFPIALIKLDLIDDVNDCEMQGDQINDAGYLSPNCT